MKLNLKKKDTTRTKVYVGVWVYDDVRNFLNDVAEQNGVSLAQVMRTAINNLLDKETPSWLKYAKV